MHHQNTEIQWKANIYRVPPTNWAANTHLRLWLEGRSPLHQVVWMRQMEAVRTKAGNRDDRTSRKRTTNGIREHTTKQPAAQNNHLPGQLCVRLPQIQRHTVHTSTRLTYSTYSQLEMCLTQCLSYHLPNVGEQAVSKVLSGLNRQLGG